MKAVKILSPIDRGIDFVLKVRCPECHRFATFEAVGVHDMGGRENAIRIGQRRCPNDECRAMVTFVADGATLVRIDPPERIDFDATDIPPKILDAFAEAITCHAHECYKAAAVMVRRTIEELCDDKGAAGDRLVDRIRSLSSVVVLPEELLEGIDELRLLGNDATHVELKDFDAVGKEEAELAIEFAKELLKAVYQYSALLEKIRARKKGAGTADGSP